MTTFSPDTDTRLHYVASYDRHVQGFAACGVRVGLVSRYNIVQSTTARDAVTCERCRELSAQHAN